jgi:predicted dehydrogenase
MNIAIIGCGLIGLKRMKSLGSHRLIAVSDVQLGRARQLAGQSKDSPIASTDWRSAVQRADVDLVIVATTNNVLAEIGIAAAQAGKHVLIEKPAARRFAELFHPSLQKAREIFDSGGIGPLMFMRGRYGHGGRVGYDREWRADPEIAGGGEMLDQGVHIIDLARWFAGDFPKVEGEVGTFFWDMKVEDNGFAILTTAIGQVAFLHASCSEWKNTFSLEIYGRTGKLQIDGLGGSYGVERLSYYKMLPQMGPPETTIWEYPGEDLSFKKEFDHMIDCIENNRPPCGGLQDALESLKIVEKLYANSSM